MPSFMPMEKPTREMEDGDPGKTAGRLVASFHRPSAAPQGHLPPASQPRGRFLRDLGRRPVLLWTAHCAAVARRRPAGPWRRQEANRVPGGSWDARRAGAALQRGPAGEGAPARTALASRRQRRRRRRPARPLLPAPPSGPLGRSGRPKAWVRAQPPRARRGGGAVRAANSACTGHCPAASPRSLPAAPPPSWQPRLGSRRCPDFGAGNGIGRTPGAANGGCWKLSRRRGRTRLGPLPSPQPSAAAGAVRRRVSAPWGAGQARRLCGCGCQRGPPRQAGGAHPHCTCWSGPPPARTRVGLHATPHQGCGHLLKGHSRLHENKTKTWLYSCVLCPSLGQLVRTRFR